MDTVCKMESKQFTFKKEERLKSRKEIDRLFKTGNSFHQYPFRWVWSECTEEESDKPTRIGISVSKRKFKLAVDRNRMKRRIREAWRLNKHLLYNQIQEGHYSVMLIFTGKQEEDLPFLSRKIRKGMERLSAEISKKNKE